MSKIKKIDRKYKTAPRCHQEFNDRLPDEYDNPFAVIEHIMYCRVMAGEIEDWHDEYINRILDGLLSGNLNSELGIENPGRRQGTYDIWKEDVLTEHMIMNANKLNLDWDIPLGGQNEEKGYKTLSDIYNVAQTTVRDRIRRYNKKREKYDELRKKGKK